MKQLKIRLGNQLYPSKLTMHILLQVMHHLNEYLTLCLITIYYHNSKTYADGVFSKVSNLDCVNLSKHCK